LSYIDSSRMRVPGEGRESSLAACRVRSVEHKRPNADGSPSTAVPTAKMVPWLVLEG
jgi:hypothetical protein